MIFLDGVKIPAFDVRNVLSLNTSPCTDKYHNLWRSVSRSKVAGSDRNYKIGEEIEKLSTEFYSFGQNILFVCEEDKNKFTYIMVLHGHLFAKSDDIDNTDLKLFMSKHNYKVYDAYGKLLTVNSYESLVDMINNTIKLREELAERLSKYETYMDILNELRRKSYQNIFSNCGEIFDKYLVLMDEIGKEARDCLTEIYFSTEDKTLRKYIVSKNDSDKIYSIFGLYLAVLKSWILSFQGEYLGYDERAFRCFLAEFDLFLKEHENILDEYIKYFNLPQRVKEEIESLLSAQALGTDKWDNVEFAELTIL